MAIDSPSTRDILPRFNASIAKRLQRIQKNLRRVGGKARMTHDEALAEIIDMAKKYAPYYTAQESLLNEQETNAEIILSESFNKL